MSDPTTQPPLPVSLVLTVLNEERSLPAFLESIALQTRMPDEIVVVDGGSTDGTVELLRAWSAPDGVTVRVLVEPGANIAAGRNAAIRAARNDRIAVSDAGATLAAAWLATLHDALADGADVASGFFRPVGHTFLGRTIATTITPRLREIDPASFLPSSRSLGITREAWHRVGGYPEWLDYCEDLVFDLALKRAGFRFAFVPSAEVTWDGRPEMRAFGKQYYRYARGDGKSGLWARRHLARYAAYTVGATLLLTLGGSPWVLAALAVGFAGYQSRFLGRVLRSDALTGWSRLAGVALVPVVVVIGDLSKMVGYPAGLVWRARATRAGLAL